MPAITIIMHIIITYLHALASAMTAKVLQVPKSLAVSQT